MNHDAGEHAPASRAPSFRLAQPADAPAIRALVERAYRGDSARAGWTHEADLLSGERTSLDEVSAIIAAPDKFVVLAEQGSALAGSVTVTDLGDGRCYLGMLAVDPALQAGGIGRSLMAEAETQAMCRFGARVMEMTVIARRAELIAYYERRGYHRTGEIRPFPVEVPEAASFSMAVLERALG